MKIAVIGGGSTYTPELAEGLVRPPLRDLVTRLTLMDIDEARLAIVGGFASRQVKHAQEPFAVELTTDLAEAVRGTRYVIIQLRVGGQKARHEDVCLCLERGVLGQETTGAAGFAKALRTIPVIHRIIDVIERECSELPVIINFTNPAGLITEAITRKYPGTVVGLCNVPIKVLKTAAESLQAVPERVWLDYVGLNHLAWVRNVYLDGRDVTERVVTDLVRARAADVLGAPDYDEHFLRGLRAIPTTYLKYYYLTDSIITALQKHGSTRAQEVMRIEGRLLELYSDPNLVERPPELNRRGGAFYSTMAANLIGALEDERATVHIVNVRNGGAIPDFPADAVVEVPALVNSATIRPLATSPLDAHPWGLMTVVKAYERLTIEAVERQSLDLALLALSTHPLVPSTSLAKELLDEFVRRHELELR